MRTVVGTFAMAVAVMAICVQPDADAAVKATGNVDWDVRPARLATFGFGNVAIPFGTRSSQLFDSRFSDEIESLRQWGKAPDLTAKAIPDAGAPPTMDAFDKAPGFAEGVPLPPARPRALASINPTEFKPSLKLSHISFSGTALAPMAHVRFCLKYPGECKNQKMLFRPRSIALTEERLQELQEVNRAVNRAIRPQHMHEGVADEQWLILPKSGDCNDYAVSKRHELLARGWPGRSLLLAEVITSWGEHHLVLVIRTKQGDVVADNLNQSIRGWSETGYEWVRIQTPRNPSFWATIKRAPAV